MLRAAPANRSYQQRCQSFYRLINRAPQNGDYCGKNGTRCLIGIATQDLDHAEMDPLHDTLVCDVAPTRVLATSYRTGLPVTPLRAIYTMAYSAPYDGDIGAAKTMARRTLEAWGDQPDPATEIECDQAWLDLCNQVAPLT